MNYSQTVSEDRRLLILRALANANAYTASALLLKSFLGSFGHQVSADLVVGELAWLEEQALVKAVTVDGQTLATLTLRGLDVTSGAAQTPGVRRPMPGE